MQPQKPNDPSFPPLPTPVELDGCPLPDPRLNKEERRLIGLRQALLDLMRYYSEEVWAAAWSSGLEYDLWRCASGRSRRITWQESEGLSELARLAGGWWVSEGIGTPVFLPMDGWLTRFAAWERRDGAS